MFFGNFGVENGDSVFSVFSAFCCFLDLLESAYAASLLRSFLELLKINKKYIVELSKKNAEITYFLTGVDDLATVTVTVGLGLFNSKTTKKEAISRGNNETC